MFGAQNQDSVKSEATYIQKIPKTKYVFGAMSKQTLVESLSFFYPDYYCRLRSCNGSCARALVGYTTDRELHPAPKVEYLVNWIIPVFRFSAQLLIVEKNGPKRKTTASTKCNHETCKKINKDVRLVRFGSFAIVFGFAVVAFHMGKH